MEKTTFALKHDARKTRKQQHPGAPRGVYKYSLLMMVRRVPNTTRSVLEGLRRSHPPTRPTLPTAGRGKHRETGRGMTPGVTPRGYERRFEGGASRGLRQGGRYTMPVSWSVCTTPILKKSKHEHHQTTPKRLFTLPMEDHPIVHPIVPNWSTLSSHSLVLACTMASKKNAIEFWRRLGSPGLGKVIFPRNIQKRCLARHNLTLDRTAQ